MFSIKTKVIREYVVHNNGRSITFILRTNFYSSTLDYWQDLYDLAHNDGFKDLHPNKTKCREYDGDTHRGQRGIEFVYDMPVTIPDRYEQRTKMIPTK